MVSKSPSNFGSEFIHVIFEGTLSSHTRFVCLSVFDRSTRLVYLSVVDRYIYILKAGCLAVETVGIWDVSGIERPAIAVCL